MKELRSKRFDKSGVRERDELLAEESYLSVKVNGQHKIKVSITPKSLKYFILGFLLGEGYIDSEEDISSLSFSRGEDCFVSEVKTEGKSTESGEVSRQGSVVELRSLGDKKRGDRIDGKAILRGCKRALERTEEFSKTGAYHYGYLVDYSGRIKKRGLDIGRHNAVDKVIGKGLLSEKNFDRSFIFTTGRISSKMVGKCIRCKIPLLVSRGAPTYEAVKLGQKFGLCVIGFLRRGRFNIYNEFDFIKL